MASEGTDRALARAPLPAAAILHTYLTESRIARHSELPLCNTEEYLGGLLDFTGELNRVAVAAATSRDKAAVQRYYEVVDELQLRLTELNLRHPALLKKLGPLDATSRKLAHTLYELSLSEGSLFAGLRAVADVEPRGFGGGGGGGEGTAEAGESNQF